MGQANSGIPCCSFNNSAAWFKKASLLGILDDEQCGPVLDASARVLELGFSQNVTAGLFGEAVQAN